MATIGIDVGNKTIKGVVFTNKIVKYAYLPNLGIVTTLKKLLLKLRMDLKISGVGVCGAGRLLTAKLIGADVVKTEILAQTIGALHYFPDAKTLIELGGEDSKIIKVKNGIIEDFTMNSLCSAGCGAYLDNIAYRFGIMPEDFAKIALKSKNPVTISSKCSVFGCSSALSKLHQGVPIEDILMGVALGLARNYLAMLSKGKKLEQPIVFSGGVSQNKAVVKAFEQVLGVKVLTHRYGHLFGAIGMALLSRDVTETKFAGFNITELPLRSETFVCNDCPNMCEIVKIKCDDKVLAQIGSKCGKYD